MRRQSDFFLPLSLSTCVCACEKRSEISEFSSTACGKLEEDGRQMEETSVLDNHDDDDDA